ncbi:MAG: potassium transporter KefB [Peptococcaceae bacterium BICA1-8]|nr:MAG: potassium transporter KefB [Peptococcaceae bacterium BICA1-8]
MEIKILNDIIVIFGLAILVLYLFSKLRIPAILGFFVTGALAGPYGLQLVKNVHEVEVLAEIGVILLLFSIGIEFSLGQLVKIKRLVLWGGGLQVVATIIFASLFGLLFGLPWGESIFIGFLVALSSTAIVLKILQNSGEVNTPHGNNILGILIFQDIIIVPMLLLLPLLAGTSQNIFMDMGILVIKGVVVLLLAIIAAKWVVPYILHNSAKSKNSELFLLSIIAICLTIAWLTSQAGLSLALGAFLAGLIISETEYSHQALGNIIPFRDAFTSVFFVSIGMLLNINVFLDIPLLVLGLTLLVILIKIALIILIILIFLKYPIRSAILAGLSLAQIGEFSFILSQAGIKNGLLANNHYQIFIAVSILSMTLTPYLIMFSPKIAGYISNLPFLDTIRDKNFNESEEKVTITNHLIIVGFGLNGRHLKRVAEKTNIPYIVLEVNPETVRTEKQKGTPIYYGDPSQDVILEHVNIKEARAAVIAISDSAATQRIVDAIRKRNPHMYILARTPYLQEVKTLYTLGASEVITQEYETSIEIFYRVLVNYLVPQDEIEAIIHDIRSDGYEMLRDLSTDIQKESTTKLDLYLSDVEISTLRVIPSSFLVNKTLMEVNLRKNHGVTILALRRDKKMIPNPHGTTKILEGDLIMVLGAPQDISKVCFSCNLNA